MDTLIQDVRISTRALLRQPGFTAVAVLTLALGCGGAITMFSVVHAVLLRPLPYRDADRIVALWQTARDNPAPSVGGSTSHLNFLDWKRRASSFEALAVYARSLFTLSGLGQAEVVPAAVVTPGFFEVFGARPAIGRDFTPDEDLPTGPEAIIVSHGFWKDRLGGVNDVLGRTILIGGRPRPIVGVAPPGFDFPAGARLWMPVKNDDEACGRGCLHLEGVGRLRTTSTVPSAREEMRLIAERLEQLYPNDNANVTVALASLQDQIVGDVRPPLLLLSGAVLMVLLIACANLANLLLARGASRQREIAIRGAIGAGRWRLLSFLLTESLVLAVTGAALGWLLSVWGLDAVRWLAPANVPRLDEARVGGAAAGFALGLAALVAVFFGLGPALHYSRQTVATILGNQERGSAGPARAGHARTALLTGQVALSMLLLVGSGLLLRSLARLHAVDPGWQAGSATVLSLSFPSARYGDADAVTAAQERVREQLSTITGVTSVGRIWGMPLGLSENVLNFVRTDRPTPPPAQMPLALYRVIDDYYFPTMGIPIVSGRNFTSLDRRATQPVIIISRVMAERYWPDEDPVGHQVRVGSEQPALTIVGVAADVRSTSLTMASQPEMYVPQPQTESRAATYVLRGPATPADVLAAARAIVRRFDPTLPIIRPGTLEGLLDEQMARPRFYLLLLGLFAVLALTLAAVGLYGVVAYLVSRRTREAAIRMAVGARAIDIVTLMAADGVRPALVGVGLGLAGALLGGRLIAGLLYGVTPSDPLTLAAAATTLMLVTICASVVPAVRATRIPQTLALRVE